MGEKSRGCFATGGWCSVRKACANDALLCDQCHDYSEFEEQPMKSRKKNKKEFN